MRLKFFVILSFVILFVGFISADFTIENIGNQSHSINKEYCALDDIQGWINISLINEPTDSKFNDSFGNAPTLLDLLQGNTYSYNCTPSDCSPDYSATSPLTTKSFILDKGKSKLVGFKLTENLDSINSVDFQVDSNASSDCENQLEINFFNNNKFVIKNNKSSEGGCPSLKSYGCFTTGITEVDLESTPFCQRINFSESPGFEIGAWVKGTGTHDVKMKILNLNGGNSLAECTLSGITSKGKEVNCSVNFEVKKLQEYYVCIYATDDEEYTTLKNSSNDCAFQGNPPGTEQVSYQIFAQGKKFATPETLYIANEQEGSKDLNVLFKDYIETKYGSLDCSAGCVIPINITSYQDSQNITLSDLELKYSSSGTSTERNFFDLIGTPAKVNSGFGKLFLNFGNFSVSGKPGNYNYSLEFNGQEIFNESIAVKNISMRLFPTATAFGVPTTFKLIINPAQNITSYFWEFGDDKNATTTLNKVEHTYDSFGIKQAKVAITTTSGISFSKTYPIIVNSPEQYINTQIISSQSKIDKINSKISLFSTFEKTEIQNKLNLSSIKRKLDKIKTENTAAVNESDYILIVNKILALEEIPDSIEITKQSLTPFTLLPKPENIDLDLLEDSYNETYNSSNEQAYLDAIQAWNLKNIETKMDFKEISVTHGTDIEPLLSFVKLNINKKNDSKAYLFLLKFEKMNFKNSRIFNRNSDYVSIALADSTTIEFSTTEEIEFMELPYFISPAISELSIVKTNYKIDSSFLISKKWIIFGLIVAVLIISGAIIFFILKAWYKKRYETHLFKDRNNLYNLITYINNAKTKGLSDDKIINSLKKAKWNSEQIRYGMRKYVGKKTGL